MIKAPEFYLLVMMTALFAFATEEPFFLLIGPALLFVEYLIRFILAWIGLLYRGWKGKRKMTHE